MSSRQNILNAVRQNQPELTPLPEVPQFAPYFGDLKEKFTGVLEGIGATVHFVRSYEDIIRTIREQVPEDVPFANTLPELAGLAALKTDNGKPHGLEHTELAIIRAAFGVAENGAIWITEHELPERVLPFIPQHLAALLHGDQLVPTMHDAYRIIGADSYGWGAFIAGPSKTADIE